MPKHEVISIDRHYAWKKWPLRGSKHGDNLNWFQLSGFGCQEGEPKNPET